MPPMNPKPTSNSERRRYKDIETIYESSGLKK